MKFFKVLKDSIAYAKLIIMFTIVAEGAHLAYGYYVYNIKPNLPVKATRAWNLKGYDKPVDFFGAMKRAEPFNVTKMWKLKEGAFPNLGIGTPKLNYDYYYFVTGNEARKIFKTSTSCIEEKAYVENGHSIFLIDEKEKVEKEQYGRDPWSYSYDWPYRSWIKLPSYGLDNGAMMDTAAITGLKIGMLRGEVFKKIGPPAYDFIKVELLSDVPGKCEKFSFKFADHIEEWYIPPPDVRAYMGSGQLLIRFDENEKLTAISAIGRGINEKLPQ